MGVKLSTIKSSGPKSPKAATAGRNRENEAWILKYLIPDDSLKVKEMIRSKIKEISIPEEDDYTNSNEMYEKKTQEELDCKKLCRMRNNCDESDPDTYFQIHCDPQPNKVKAAPRSATLYLSPASIYSNRTGSILDEKLYPIIRTEPESLRSQNFDHTENDHGISRVYLRSAIRATTHVIFRVRPFVSKIPTRRKNEHDVDSLLSWVTIEYRFNREDDSDYFHVSGPMENILRRKKSHSSTVYTLEDQRRHYFFRYFRQFMNNLEGRVWWNGFIIELESNTARRFTLAEFTMEPTRLAFQLKGLDQVEVTKTTNRFQLCGKVKEKPVKFFNIRGEAIVRLTVKYPGNGTIVVIFPDFISGIL